MPQKKYNVIYADPPWDVKRGRSLGSYSMLDGKQAFKGVDNLPRDLAYPVMTVAEISQLPVKDISAKNSHLYIWVTNKHLPEVFTVIESWGFKYSTIITWCKSTMGGGLGGSHRIAAEYLIFCTKGTLKATQVNRTNWHLIKREYVNGVPMHSRKPKFFRKLIESTSPGRKIEL